MLMAVGKISKPLGPDSAFANFSGKMWYGSISKALLLEITLLLLQTAQLPNKIAHLSLIPPPSDLYQNRRPFTKSYLLDLALLATTGKHYITTGTHYITTVLVLAKAGNQDPVGVKVYKFCLSLSLSLSLFLQ